MANCAAVLREELATDDGDNDRIYEEIEAPKFVDFSAPEKSLPDDSSWFCARIGCNQQHEEIDPEALHKSFVLRVLAARSPNIRFQKALSMHAQSRIPRCPRTAPAKSAKDGVQKFSTVSMIPRKIKDHPISSLRSTPVAAEISKQDVMSSKTLATPIARKKCPTGAEPDRIVQNSKQQEPISVKKPAVKFVALGTEKRLQKAANGTCKTPISEMCSGMKKLQISSSQTKNVTRHLWSVRKEAATRATGLIPSESFNKNRESSTKQEQKDQQDISLPEIQGIKLEEDDATNSEEQTEKVIAKISSPSSSDSESSEFDGVKGKIEDDDSLVLDDNKERVKGKIEDDDSLVLDDNKENAPDNHDEAENSIETMDHDENQQQSQKQSTEEETAGKKTKGTNPKPFRFRTYERGVLREANLEKKLLKQTLKEAIHVEANKFEKTTGGRGGPLNLEKKLLKQTLKEAIHVEANKFEKTTGGRGGPLTSITPQRRKHNETGTDSGASKRKKLMKLAAAPQTPNGRTPSSKSTTTTTTKTRLEEKGGSNCQKKEIRVKTPNRTTSSPWTRKPSTVPREPNFHKIHVPKCCTKQLENIFWYEQRN